MPRRLSSIAPDWWDYTTLPHDLIEAVARLTPRDLERLSRPGFKVLMYDTLEEFYLAEALEYIEAGKTFEASEELTGAISFMEGIGL